MANVVELKVGLHCDECIKKIFKAIKKMDGKPNLSEFSFVDNASLERSSAANNNMGWDMDWSGIDTYEVDVERNKVVVTGNVKPEQVIKALHKIGKQAAVWGEGEAAGR